MSTGEFTSWSNVADIGPIYPFVGSEMVLVIAAFVLWIGWHVVQLRQEAKENAQASRKVSDSDSLRQQLEKARH